MHEFIVIFTGIGALKGQTCKNGIVHEYRKTDYTIVFETATQDLEVVNYSAIEKLMIPAYIPKKF